VIERECSFRRADRTVVGTISAQFDLLQEAVPKNATKGFLVNPANPYVQSDTRDAQAAADALGQKLVVVKAETENDVEVAFATLLQRGVGALIIAGDQFMNSRRHQIIALAAHYSLPTIYPWRDAAVAGGLMSYGSHILDAYYLAGIYTGRILKGEKPADLPVQQSTGLELVINLKTAKALGLTVPPTRPRR
jgi:putative tryptophan/tyrosine transport system substrate-binding protein